MSTAAGLPNIIYLHTHDLGRFLEPYGRPVATPRLAAFAREGVLFRRAFSVAPTCSPSRAALLTGRYPHQTGMHGLSMDGFAIADVRQHLGSLLRTHGYDTALSGVHHVGHLPELDPSTLPYNRFLNHQGPNKRWDALTTIDRACDYLRERRRERHRPFFLSVGLDYTHQHWWRDTARLAEPIFGPPDPRYIAPPPTMPDAEPTRRDTAHFHRAIQYMDYRVGQLLDALEASGLADRTLVIFTTDHGAGYPGMKMSCNDAGTETALILRGPGPFQGGRVVESLVSQIDLYPTLCDWLGLPRPPWLEGVSLLPLFAPDGPAEVREHVFAQNSYHAGRFAPIRSVRTHRHRYIRLFDAEPKDAGYYCTDENDTFAYLCAAGLRQRLQPIEQLYDLVFDPLERVNLVGTAGIEEVVDPLRETLLTWMRAKGDPALDGAIPRARTHREPVRTAPEILGTAPLPPTPLAGAPAPLGAH